ncbi:MAG: NUDIX domain-containing protein [Opitutaceae bacterium]
MIRRRKSSIIVSIPGEQVRIAAREAIGALARSDSSVISCLMFLTEQARFCPKCGSEDLDLKDRKLLDCRSCGLHFYLNSASAVAGYILDGTDRLLLVRRARDPGKGMLSPPGGFLDFGETGEEAVVREIREETGLDVTIAGYLGSFPNLYVYRGITYPTLDLFFLCRVASFDGAVALEEVESVVVVPWQNVKREEIAFESMRRAFDQLKSELS